MRNRKRGRSLFPTVNLHSLIDESSGVLECDKVALFEGISAHGCLSTIVHPHSHQVAPHPQVSDSNLDLPKLVDSFLKK